MLKFKLCCRLLHYEVQLLYKLTENQEETVRIHERIDAIFHFLLEHDGNYPDAVRR